jgi:hypothetical protein
MSRSLSFLVILKLSYVLQKQKLNGDLLNCINDEGTVHRKKH